MRYAIGLEYDGSEFLGWQVQRQEPTVQGCVEQALARVADHELRVTCCGRTDAVVTPSTTSVPRRPWSRRAAGRCCDAASPAASGVIAASSGG